MANTEAGLKIKIARIRKFMTQKEAAAELGISTSALSYYESGKRTPRDSEKQKFADFCGLSIQDLFFTV